MFAWDVYDLQKLYNYVDKLSGANEIQISDWWLTLASKSAIYQFFESEKKELIADH